MFVTAWFWRYLQYRKRMEAEMLRKEEEAKLRKQMNAKKAKEEAERLHRVSSQSYSFVQTTQGD